MIVARKLDLGRGWFRAPGVDGDVVISSRIRLGRNVDGFPFGDRLAAAARRDLSQRLRTTIANRTDSFCHFRFAEQDSDFQAVLLERNLLTGENRDVEEIYLRDDQRCVVTPFDGDHVGLSGLRSGLELGEIQRDVARLAEEIDRSLPFAVSLHWGYIGANPGQAGAMLQAAVLLHLPALVELGDPNSALTAVGSRGVRLELFRSGHSGSLANVYQVSNVPMCGADEEQILIQLEEVIGRLVHYEREARAQLLNSQREEMEDSVQRAIGLLRYTPAIRAEDAMVLLSWIRLGAALELTDEISMEEATALLFVSQRSHVMRVSQSTDDEDGCRAVLLRQRLAAES